MAEIIRIGGVELRFLQSRHDTRGSLDLFEVTIMPGARMPVPHYHRDWDETVYGLVGTNTWTISGQEIDVLPGESLFIPRGVVHGFDNRSSQPATCLSVLTPGVLGPEYFREMAALVSEGPPDPEKMKAVMTRHGLVPAPQG